MLDKRQRNHIEHLMLEVHPGETGRGERGGDMLICWSKALRLFGCIASIKAHHDIHPTPEKTTFETKPYKGGP